jgi:hypothetical protein
MPHVFIHEAPAHLVSPDYQCDQVPYSNVTESLPRSLIALPSSETFTYSES